ncbi:DUF4367 domain-containing protein, partial [Candidatus Saccharibacteria bacterium]|nr:DUF4367 domain-containing protein [Candidatus Saccharibacteria bacterium]
YKNHASADTHTSLQKSTTLKRQYVSRPKISIKITEPEPSPTEQLADPPIDQPTENSLPIESSEDSQAQQSIEESPSEQLQDSPKFQQPIEETPISESVPTPLDEPDSEVLKIISTPQSPTDNTSVENAPVEETSTVEPLEVESSNEDISSAFAQPEESVLAINPDATFSQPDILPINPDAVFTPINTPSIQAPEIELEEETVPPPTPRELKNEAIQIARNQYAEQREEFAVERVIAEEAQEETYAPISQSSTQQHDHSPQASPTKSPLSQTLQRQRKHTSIGKFIMAFATSAACIGILGYFVSINMPSISVHVAAMQTGIEAAYPSYIPREYQLSGVSTQDGNIVINFTGDEGKKFNITEEKTSWDSNALLNNYVKENWDDYDTIREQGITIYVHDSNAAWINGSTFYRIVNLNGILTKKQIKNIATSLR